MQGQGAPLVTDQVIEELRHFTPLEKKSCGFGQRRSREIDQDKDGRPKGLDNEFRAGAGVASLSC